MNLPNYENDHYELDNGEELHQEFPESFWIPEMGIRESLQPGSLAKLIFRMEETKGSNEVSVERMWVQVIHKDQNHYKGTLENDPAGSECVKFGQTVHFQPCHVIEVYEN